MNAIASCTLPDETAPLAEQMRALSDLLDYAMRMARLAVEQYEAAAAPSANATPAPTRRQPDPGSLFIRLARVVQTCIFGQSRLAAGLPLTRAAAPSARVPQARNPVPIAEELSAEPVRVALRAITRNHPHGQKRLAASLEHLATTLATDPAAAADLPALFRRICNEAGIHPTPSQWRKAARDLAREIRAAPA